MQRMGTSANSKSTLRQAQGERYFKGILIVPFMVSLSNHNSYFCKRLIWFPCSA